MGIRGPGRICVKPCHPTYAQIAPCCTQRKPKSLSWRRCQRAISLDWLERKELQKKLKTSKVVDAGGRKQLPSPLEEYQGFRDLQGKSWARASGLWGLPVVWRRCSGGRQWRRAKGIPCGLVSWLLFASKLLCKLSSGPALREEWAARLASNAESGGLKI